MEIRIREWKIGDLQQIEQAWINFSRGTLRPDMRLKRDCEKAMRQWLLSRFKEPGSLGFVAEKDGVEAGFLIGRIDLWESTPPIVEPRKLGIIDAVYVNEQFRGLAIGKRLIERALETMQERRVAAIETIFDAESGASSAIWRHAGFAPWMVHAYRTL